MPKLGPSVTLAIMIAGMSLVWACADMTAPTRPSPSAQPPRTSNPPPIETILPTPPPTETGVPIATSASDETTAPTETTVATAFAPPTPAATRLTEEDAGRSIGLNVGDQLEIALAGNPTTGYQWEVGSGNDNILQQRSEPVFAPESDAVGSGGTVTLTFNAVATGRVALQLIYHPQYDRAAPPIQTYAVTVIVQ